MPMDLRTLLKYNKREFFLLSREETWSLRHNPDREKQQPLWSDFWRPSTKRKKESKPWWSHQQGSWLTKPQKLSG